MHVEEGLEDVQHPRHLREQQAAVALAAEAWQQLAYASERRRGRTEHLELAAVVLEEALLRELHGVELTPLVDGASTREGKRDQTDREEYACCASASAAGMGVEPVESAMGCMGFARAVSTVK